MKKYLNIIIFGLFVFSGCLNRIDTLKKRNNYLWFFSSVNAQTDDSFKIEYSQSQILYPTIIVDDDYNNNLYYGSNTIKGFLTRNDFTFLYNDYLEFGFFSTSGTLSLRRNPEGNNIDYPVVNGIEVRNISDMKFSGIYTGFRTPWPKYFYFAGRVGLGKEEYLAEKAQLNQYILDTFLYKSYGIYLDAIGGVKKQFGIIDAGLIIGYSGIFHAVESEVSDRNLYLGLNISLNFKKSLFSNINQPKFKSSQTIITKKSDYDPPSILIESPPLKQNIFRTIESQLSIRGKATDLVGMAFVKINNKNVHLDESGYFIKRQKLKIGKNLINIKAIDINDNTSEKEFYIVREEYFEDEYSDVDFPLVTKNNNKSGIAVVIGIEDYQYAPPVSYAYNDADVFREYLVKTFGFKRENIYYKTNNHATKGEFEKIFSKNGWLAKHSNKKSDIFIFYAGHGAPNIETGTSYLIPYDIDPNYSTTGYSLDKLYNNLGNVKSKSITVILDACFSGGTRENQSLLSNARPVYIEVQKGNIPSNIIVFTAASGKEISSGYKQKSHGIFTYYFLKGLKGEADSNEDKKISNLEMYNYLGENVLIQARRIGREQNPQLLGGSEDKILLTY